MLLVGKEAAQKKSLFFGIIGFLAGGHICESYFFLFVQVESYEMDKVDWKKDYIDLDEPWMKSAHEDAGIVPHRQITGKNHHHHNQNVSQDVKKDPHQNKQP